MDNFMDEIVQKFTPQEMIRANAAADAAEIESLEKQLPCLKNRWRNMTTAFRKCVR